MQSHTSFIVVYEYNKSTDQKQKGADKKEKILIKLLNNQMALIAPFQQAKRYYQILPYSQRPRWMITCNLGIYLYL